MDGMDAIRHTRARMRAWGPLFRRAIALPTVRCLIFIPSSKPTWATWGGHIRRIVRHCPGRCDSASPWPSGR